MPSRYAKMAGLNAVLNQFGNLQDQWGGDATWVVGTNVIYGLFLETGTSRMPPYPWLGPAIDDVVQSGAGDRIADNASGTDDLIRGVALEIEERARQRTMSSSQRPYPDTGNLASSIQARKVA